MLEYLRNAAEKPVAKILIGILAFSFVGWGVAEWIFGGAVGDNTLVRVGGDKITATEFNQERSRQIAQMPREQQRAIYSDAATANAFNASVLTTLATQQMTENRANDLGFVVTDRKIADEIRNFDEFKVDGKFSPAAFDMVLSRSGYSEADFANILRSQALRSMVLGAMSVPMNVPEFAARAAYNAKYATRDVEYVAVDLNQFKVDMPSDDELRAFYAQNPKTIPEVRTVSYVLVPAKMDKPDEYDAALSRAQKVEDDIIAGESMAKAAAAHNAKYVKPASFNAVATSVDAVIDTPMVARVFAMDEGVESELIETKDGFIIIRVEKVDPAHNADFDSVKKSLVHDWIQSQKKQQAYLRANELLVDYNKDGKLAGAKSTKVSRASGASIDVLAGAFANPVGTKTIIPGANGFYVIGITKEVMPTVETSKMAAIKKELANMSSREIMDDYNAFLVRKYPMKVNKKVYTKMLGAQ